MRLPGYGGPNADTTAVGNFEIGQNTLNDVSFQVSASANVPGGGDFVGGAACAQPTVPS